MADRLLIAEKMLDEKILRGHCSRCGQVFSEVNADDLGPVQHQFEVHPCVDTQRLRKGLFKSGPKPE